VPSPIETAAPVRGGKHGVGRQRTNAVNGACSGTCQRNELLASSSVLIVICDGEDGRSNTRVRGAELDIDDATVANRHRGAVVGWNERTGVSTRDSDVAANAQRRRAAGI